MKITALGALSVLLLFVRSLGASDDGVDESIADGHATIPNDVLVQKVRRCRNSFPCNSVLDDDDFCPLDKAISKWRARKLYISQVNDPGNARHVVLFIAGQRFLPSSDGSSGGLTGQREGYRITNWTRGRKLVTLRADFYARRFLNRRFFSEDDTFVGLVFDARFHYEYGSRTKSDIVGGYLNYINSKIRTNVETIFLAGHSRGGCLALRLAKRLVREYPRARVIVQGFDPVCADGLTRARELGVDFLNPSTSNPLVAADNWRVRNTNFEEQFSPTERSCLSIHNFLSGDPVPWDWRLYNIDEEYNVRAFGHTGFVRGGTGTLLHDNRTWYEQSWSTRSHTDIVNDGVLWGRGFAHFDAAMLDMPEECGTYPLHEWDNQTAYTKTFWRPKC